MNTDRYQTIQDTIVDAAKKGKILDAFARLFYIGIDPGWTTEVYKSLADRETGKIDVETFAKAIHKKFESNFDGISGVLGCDSVITADLERNLKDLFILFLRHFEEDWRTVEQYRDFLLSKKRQLAKRDKWGDIDLRPWANCINEFSKEKLNAGEVDKVVENMPEQIIEYLRSVGIPPVGISLVLACLQSEEIRVLHSDRKEGTEEIRTTPTSGADYEIQIKEKIEAEFPSFLVELTQATGDQGADIILSSPSRKIAIQAKFYSGPVGNAAVQEVFAAKAYYEADECIVVTPSSYTASAKLLASKTGVILATDYDIIDFLRELIEER